MDSYVFSEIEKLLKLGHTYESIEVITGYSIEEIKKIDTRIKENWRNQVKTKGANNE